MGVNEIKVKQFSLRMTKEVAAYVKHGGALEEALLGLILTTADLISQENDDSLDVRNKFLVKAREGGVSFSVLQRLLTNDDSLNLAAHLAVAAGSAGPEVVRRMALIMEKKP